MFTMEWLKDAAMVVYYVSLSIMGPVALFGYLQAKKKEQQPTFPEMGDNPEEGE